MATTTRVALLELLSEQFGDWWSDTTTSNGNAGGTTLIDTSLAKLSLDDDFCINWYVRITSGTNDGEIGKVSAYAQSTNTITVTSAFTGQVLSGVTYELHRLNPAQKLNALSRASVNVYPELYLELRDESLVIDDRLTDLDFEKAHVSSKPPDWTSSGSPTLSAETSTVWHGKQSLKMVSGGSLGQLYQALTINVAEIAGKIATFKARVWTAAASQARIAIHYSSSSSDQHNSDYHTGDSSWRLLSVSASVPDTPTYIRAYVETTANDTAYFDGGGSTGFFVGRIYRYTLPAAMLRGPFSVLHQVREDDIDGPYYQLPPYTAPLRGRQLRLRGMGILSQPTTDTGTVEIGEPRVELFIAHASRWLYRALLQGPNLEQREYMARLRDDWTSEIARMELTKGRGGRGLAMSVPPAEIPYGTWHPEEDADRRYLIFDQLAGAQEALQ